MNDPNYYDADGMARGAYESDKSPAELREEQEKKEAAHKAFCQTYDQNALRRRQYEP